MIKSFTTKWLHFFKGFCNTRMQILCKTRAIPKKSRKFIPDIVKSIPIIYYLLFSISFRKINSGNRLFIIFYFVINKRGFLFNDFFDVRLLFLVLVAFLVNCVVSELRQGTDVKFLLFVPEIENYCSLNKQIDEYKIDDFKQKLLKKVIKRLKEIENEQS